MPLELIAAPLAEQALAGREREQRPNAAIIWLRALARELPVGFRVLMLAASVEGVLTLSTIPFYRSAGLTVAWATVVPHVLLLTAMAALFGYFVCVPGSASERGLSDAVLVTFLLLLLTNIASPAQYLAVTLRRPLIDAQLAAADASLGVRVASLAAWTSAHPVAANLLRISYFTLLPQFLLPILVLGIWSADRERLWESCFHFHFCLIVTLACLALWPAACAFTHHGFPSVINQSRFVSHFQGLRQGSFHIIRFDDLEGLISMPSFHVAGALMVTWVLRGYRRVFYAVVLLNICLILSTFMTGAHYFVDVLATFLLFGLSVATYRYAVVSRSAAVAEQSDNSRARRSPTPVCALTRRDECA